MEKVALSVLKLLRTRYDVQVVCVGGDAEDLRTCPEAKILGPPLRGAKRFHAISRLKRLALELDTDVVVAVGAWVAVPWLLAGPHFWNRTIVWEHSMMVERIRHSPQLRLLAFAAGFLYRRARLVVTVSNPLEADIRSMCRGAVVTTVPNPVEVSNSMSQEAFGRSPQRLTKLLAVGSLSKIKAQHLAIQSVSLLDNSFHLNIIGSGPERSDLERLATELGVREKVTFEGYLPADIVRTRMQESDLLVHTAIVETFGLVYVEAADAGLDVVSTRTRVAEAMIPMYVPGWISEPDAAALANVILESRSIVRESDNVRAAELRRRAEFGAEAVLGKWSSILEGPAGYVANGTSTRSVT